MLAELYGGSFKVYSTREFPGLEPSTELTRVCFHFFISVFKFAVLKKTLPSLLRIFRSMESASRYEMQNASRRNEAHRCEP